MIQDKRYARPQRVRDAILAFLAKPRSAPEITIQISRPVSTEIGHLAATRRLGLVGREGCTANASVGYTGPMVSFKCHRSIGKPAMSAKVHHSSGI